MPAVVESQVAGTELERVLPKVSELFESDDNFYANIKKRDVEVVSFREMRAPLALRPGGRFQYFNPNGGDLGRGGGPTWDKATLKPVFMAEAIEYTKLTQWSTDDKRKAVIDAVRKLTAGALVEISRQIDSQLQQPGTGQIGVITSVSTTAGVDTYNLTTDGFGARLMRFDQQIQVYDATLATFRGKGIITFYDVENKQIQVTPAIAGAIATDIIVVDGVSVPTSLPALYGVPYHHSNASTGTWLGFDRSITPEIRANRVNAGSSPLTLPLPRLAINKIGNRVGIDNNFKCVAWMHPAQQQAYEEIGQLTSIIQKQAKDEALNMYFGDNMQMAGAPVKTHFNWDRTRIDFIVDSVWGRAEILPIGFYTSDGRRIFELRGPSGGVATADIFYMVVGFQTFVLNPAACSYIDALAVPSGY
jgi:preprotein translocase subunit Sec61beta